MHLSGNEAAQAGEVIEQYIGVNHRFTAAKSLPPSPETGAKPILAEFQPAHYAMLVIFMQSDVKPNVRLYGATEEVDDDDTFARAMPDLTQWDRAPLGPEQLDPRERTDLNALYEEFRRASERQLPVLEAAGFRYRVPIL